MLDLGGVHATLVLAAKSMMYLDILQGFFFLFCGIWQVHDALLDAGDCPIECEAVISVQLVPCDRPDAIDIQL